MSEITVNDILGAWSARVGRIPEGAVSEWKRVLANRDMYRCYNTAMQAVEEIAQEKLRGAHKAAPRLNNFEAKYRELIARHERERYESDGKEGCTGCGRSGLVAVVMAWSERRKRYAPVPRDRAVYCAGNAFRMYVPCTCDKGMAINASGPRYSRDILRRIHYHFVFEHNHAADDLMLACIEHQESR